MHFTPQDLVHYLLAAAGAIPLDESGIYLVSEEDSDLIEKFWTGTEITDQVFIASDVRENTPAVYLLNENERCLFCIDTNNVLQCYSFNAEEDEWVEVSLQGNGEITVHPSSRLSGCFAPGGQIVFFQDASDTALPGAGLESDRITNFMAIPNEDLTFEICALTTAGKLIRLDKNGTRTELGSVSQGRFFAVSSEECVIETMAMIKKGVKAAAGIKIKK
ncbi:hypothetical protein B7463_g4984, partial [Scytalidium lignicola]